MERFRIAAKRNRQAAREMIINMAKYSNRPFFIPDTFDTDEEVWDFFARKGWDRNALVEKMRNRDEQLPFLENLIPPGFSIRGAPGSRASLRGPGEEEMAVVEGESAHLTSSAYRSRFEQATTHLRRCVDSMNNEDYLSGLGAGIASIEAYIDHRAELYNEQHPVEEKLVDSKQSPVHFDTKAKQWIPQMTGGRGIDLGRKNWSDFKYLRQYRNDYTAHPKEHSYLVSYSDLCKRLNLFRTGIAGLLLDLHILFGGGAPSTVVRYAYLPDIEHVVEPEYS
jgi:hypothetical protein